MRQLPLTCVVLLVLLGRAQAGPAPATWVVVSSKQSRTAIAPLIAHRKAGGLRVVVVDAPSGSVPERQASIRAAVRRERARFLLLVGSARTIPVWTRAQVATDRPYGDLDRDGHAEVSVGRFPTDDPRELALLAKRTVAYERAPGTGRWRKRCALIAGEGRYSPIVDKLIEVVFAQIVRDAVHPGFDIDLTYANPRSPYCYPPARFADHVAKRFEEGALLFAYIGHGAVRSVDHVTVGAKSYPVLDARRARRLRARHAPVFVAIACWTGRFEGAGRCIGQELLAAPGGPVAFLGATRISHPVHNALLAKALVGQILAGAGTLRLGPAVDRAKREMTDGPKGIDAVRLEVLTLGTLFVGRDVIAKEMQRHVDMYVLLGDPALRLARPQALAPLHAPSEGLAGGGIVVQGALPSGGQGALTLEVPRDRSARPQAAPGETPAQRYARANARVVVRLRVDADAERLFAAPLEIPAQLPAGDYWLKVYGGLGHQTAIGARRLRVVRPGP